ncbi:MAG TPA: glycosyl hydrolase-related protein, partial [Verrucomicrobiae bacterium]
QANALDADKQSLELLRRTGVSPVSIQKPNAPTGGPDVPPVSGQTPSALDVFNTSSWERADLVTLSAEISKGRDRVTDAKGKSVASQRLSTGELVFLARSVPALGARRYHLESGASPANSKLKVTDNEISSPEFIVRISRRSGEIESLFSRALKKELAADKSPDRLNSYFYLPGSDLNGLKRNAPVKISVKESGPVFASLLVESEAPGCQRLAREVRVIAGLDQVDIIDLVDKQAVRAKEGVHFGFNFNVPNPAVSMDVPWAVVRPEIDQVPGACKNWFTVQRWVDIANKDYGVTWATPDAPLVEIGGITANLIGSLSDPKVWMDHIRPSQTIYSWAMNNHWHTNYRAEQDGPTVFRYSIRPHKSVPQDAAARFGIACAQPLLAAPARNDPPALSRLQISPANVLVSTLKPSDDGKALILRLFETAGKPSRARITWSAPLPTEIWVSNAGEKPVSRVSGAVDLPAYGLVTLRADLP